MTREARANLLFVGCLIVLILPGFLILMSRKLAGSNRPNDLPDPVPVATAYMQPPPVDPNLPRIEPRIVRDWVRQLFQAREGTGVRLARTADDRPVVSDRYVTQLAGLTPQSDGTTRVTLVRWDEGSDLATEQVAVLAEVGSLTANGTVLRTEAVDVPRPIRHALQDLSYVRPPEKVWWITASLPIPSSRTPTAIVVRFRVTSGEPTETIKLFPTRPAP